MEIRKLRALRPTSEAVAYIASPPYDVVTTEEARTLALGNPLSLLHVTRAEIDLDEGCDPYSDAVYLRAVENFRSMQREGHLIREEVPSLYIYRLEVSGHCQTGVVGLCRIDDYDSGKIKIHETTRREKEDDRTRLTSDLSANPEPIFLTYRDREEVDRILADATLDRPMFDITAQDGVRHTVWRTQRSDELCHAFTRAPCLYVADGHHRTASATRVARARRLANPYHTGKEDYNWFLCVLFGSSELNILAYNRTVSDLNGQSVAEFLEAVSERTYLHADTSPHPARKFEVSMYVDGRWYGLRFAPSKTEDPVMRLDMSRLQEDLLQPVLGIENQRTSDRIEFVGGARGTAYLEKIVDEKRASVAFSVYPVSIAEIMDMADRETEVPPKTTWFEPKLLSGFIIHTFERASGSPV